MMVTNTDRYPQRHGMEHMAFRCMNMIDRWLDGLIEKRKNFNYHVALPTSLVSVAPIREFGWPQHKCTQMLSET